MTLVLGTSLAGLGLTVSACSSSSSTRSATLLPAVTAPTQTQKASTKPPSAPASSAPASSAPAVQAAGNGPNAVPVDSGGQPFVLWSCESKPEVEPSSFVLACGDGGFGLTSVHWTKWAPADASGVGTEYLNDCTPNCASGHFHNYPVDIKLAGSDLVAQNEPFAYTRITFYYTGARPPVESVENGKVVTTYPATWSEQLWTGRPAGAKYPSGASVAA
jgi:hypothetical protein